MKQLLHSGYMINQIRNTSLCLSVQHAQADFLQYSIPLYLPNLLIFYNITITGSEKTDLLLAG